MLRIDALAHEGGQCPARSHFLPRGRIDAMGAARRHISVASASLKITPAAATGSGLAIAYHHARALLYPYMCGGPREYNCARSRARCVGRRKSGQNPGKFYMSESSRGSYKNAKSKIVSFGAECTMAGFINRLGPMHE